MRLLLKLEIFIFILNINLLWTLPMDKYPELECSSQDEIPKTRTKRAARSDIKYPKWPNATVYYKLKCKIFTKKELALINESLQEIEEKTCIKFVRIEKNDAINGYINLKCNLTGGCKSELGYQGRPQLLNLQVSRNAVSGTCMIKRKIQHEFMHALGFKHEHNSPVRNKYVKILKQNIANGWEYYFDRDNPIYFENYGCPYDYNSIMQVDSFRHSKADNLPTIITLNKAMSLKKLGTSKSVSECDITRINNMYCEKSNE